MIILSDGQLRLIYGAHQDEIVQSVMADNQAMLARFGISDSLTRLQYFLAQTAHEVGSGGDFTENLTYSSAERLIAVWPKRFNPDNAPAYLRNPQGLANHVYSNRMGNGDEASGEGWKYRGRGLIQITGKDNYRAVGAVTGLDLVNQPELAADASHLLLVACGYWQLNNLNRFADRGDFDGLSEAINPHTTSKGARREKLRQVENALQHAVPIANRNPAPTGGSRIMSNENKSGLIESLQKALNEKGYFVGKVDGIFGSKTRAGVAAFQMDNGLPLTGALDESLLAIVASAPDRAQLPARSRATAGDLSRAGSKTIAALDKSWVAALLTALIGGLGALKEYLGNGDAPNPLTLPLPNTGIRMTDAIGTFDTLCKAAKGVKGLETQVASACGAVLTGAQDVITKASGSEPVGVITDVLSTAANLILPGVGGPIASIALGLVSAFFARKAIRSRVEDHNSGANLKR